ncbi:MAG TPA: BNR-repeat neuraminidase N-terminal domain-containing protein [Bacteroidota bacterium]|nr:BNR-repeat neuraminidase N-terminal domain-containing protein [Bacteroidota bacterium]
MRSLKYNDAYATALRKGLLGMALLFLLSGASFAQGVLVTLGTGTSTTGTSAASPVNTYYRSMHIQFVYTAAEINTALSPLTGPRDLAKIGWRIASAPTTYVPLPSYTIKMKHTSATNASSYDAGPFTVVYSANYTPVNGYDTLTLTTPFNWDGSSNILVDVCWAQTVDYASEGTLYYYGGSSGDIGYYRQDGSNTCNVATSWSTSTEKPQCMMRWIPAAPMSYVSSTVTQNNVSPAAVGFSNQEILGIPVVMSGSLTPLAATSFSLNTTGTTNTADILAAKIYYTGTSPVFATTTLVGTTASPSGNFTVTGSQTLTAGTNYFWLAYDISASATPMNYVDAQCTGITIGGVTQTPTVTNPAGNRQILAPLSGNYTINPLGSGNRNFTSFTAAVNALTSVGVSGAVTFDVAPAIYTEKVTLPAIAGASSTNTITFDGGTGNAATRILQFNTTNIGEYVFMLNGADYIRLKNLTINATGTTEGVGIYITGIADYNQILNCVVNVSTSSSSSDCIAICASASSTSTSTTGNIGSNNLIQGCTLSGGYYGLTYRGNSTGNTYNQNNQFLDNTIREWYYYGMYLYYLPQMTCSRNVLLQRKTGTFTTSGGYGIYAYYCAYAPVIEKNYVDARSYGIRAYYLNSVYTSGTRGKMNNNMFALSGTSTIYGAYFYYCREMDVFNNTIHVNTTGTSTTYVWQLSGSSGYNLDFRNNWASYIGAGTGYLFYNNTSAYFTNFNYNAFYSASTASQFYYNGTTYANWAALPRTTHNVNSVFGLPYFISDTDLHSRSHVGYQAGVAVTGVVDDIDGDSRLTPPCIGADEYPAPPPEYDLAVADVRLNYADSKWARIEGAATHAVDVVLQNTGLSANPANVTVVYKVGSAPTSSADGVAQVFTPSWVGTRATVTFAQPVTALLPQPALTVYARVFWASDLTPANDVAADTRKIDIVKVHGNENFNSMIAPQFDDNPGFLLYPWLVMNNNGGATWQTRAGVGVSGSVALYYPGDSQAGNDWVFTPGAQLGAGSSYRVGFQLRSESGLPQTVEVAWGLNPDPASMTTFATFSNVTNTSFMTAKQLASNMDPYFNTPNVNGLYYLGFRVISPAAAGGLVVDDIMLDDNPSPPPKIGIGAPGAALSTFIDNPSVKIRLQANYKAPMAISKVYQVASMTNIYGSNGDFLWDVETSTPWITLVKATPQPTSQGYNFSPPRPRQFQDFTMTVNPAGLAPGVHTGFITLYGILFNDDFPPPASGLLATNQPLDITVELIIVNTGSKTGPAYEEMTLTNLSPGVFNFTGPTTGNPIADVEVTSGFIPSMTIRVYPNQLPPNITRMMYVKRYWQITHTGTAWTANITFPYADQEAAMVLDRYQLRGVRQAVLRGVWEDPIVGTSSTSDPNTNSVKVFDLNETNSGGNIALAQPYMYGKRGELPTSFALEQNHPNPFNPSTTVSFTVAEERAVRIVVYNSLGMEVGELVNDVLPAGRYSVDFDASGLPSGTYLYRMTAGDYVRTMHMVLSK